MNMRKQPKGVLRLERKDWADDVRTAINDLLSQYGIGSGQYCSDSFAVFDFDNTTSIFDVQEQMCIYQIQTMAFNIQPKDMVKTLIGQVPDVNRDLAEAHMPGKTWNMLAMDIADAYTRLWNQYGPFNHVGVSEEVQSQLLSNPDWQEFSSKIRAMYTLLGTYESHEVGYPFILYMFAGMTEEEVYQLALRSHAYYSQVETRDVTWTSPAEYPSRTGAVSITWPHGISVSENIKELWAALQDNGIDVWVVSASGTAAIRAAVDYFGLHDSCRGIIAMTVKMDAEGRYLPEYDYDTGYGYWCNPDGTWTMMDCATHAQTHNQGKVTAINNTIANYYGHHGPIAGFMDSNGDFQFCSEYQSTKLVVCFNKSPQGSPDGTGLIKCIARYEKDVLQYDLEKAQSCGDILYVLQGRDVNGMRSFCCSNFPVKLGENTPSVPTYDEMDSRLSQIIHHKMSVNEVFKTFVPSFETGYPGYRHQK